MNVDLANTLKSCMKNAFEVHIIIYITLEDDEIMIMKDGEKYMIDEVSFDNFDDVFLHIIITTSNISKIKHISVRF